MQPPLFDATLPEATFRKFWNRVTFQNSSCETIYHLKIWERGRAEIKDRIHRQKKPNRLQLLGKQGRKTLSQRSQAPSQAINNIACLAVAAVVATQMQLLQLRCHRLSANRLRPRPTGRAERQANNRRTHEHQVRSLELILAPQFLPPSPPE